MYILPWPALLDAGHCAMAQAGGPNVDHAPAALAAVEAALSEKLQVAAE